MLCLLENSVKQLGTTAKRSEDLFVDVLSPDRSAAVFACKSQPNELLGQFIRAASLCCAIVAGESAFSVVVVTLRSTALRLRFW